MGVPRRRVARNELRGDRLVQWLKCGHDVPGKAVDGRIPKLRQCWQCDGLPRSSVWGLLRGPLLKPRDAHELAIEVRRAMEGGAHGVGSFTEVFGIEIQPVQYITALGRGRRACILVVAGRFTLNASAIVDLGLSGIGEARRWAMDLSEVMGIPYRENEQKRTQPRLRLTTPTEGGE